VARWNISKWFVFLQAHYNISPSYLIQDVKSRLQVDDNYTVVTSISGGILSSVSGSEKQEKLAHEIVQFLSTTGGLSASILEDTLIRITQAADGKIVHLPILDLEAVVQRTDVSGEAFIQVNLRSGKKLLLTHTLVGFKPWAPKGLDITRIPRVVTTPDVLNVFEAIQDAVHASGPNSHEVALLKKVYEAVLNGGEAIGFNLSEERAWLARILTIKTKFSA
jgi:hypothetical protein